MKRITIIISIVLLLSSLAFSQKEPLMGQLSIKTSDGFLFINNTEDKSYLLELKGKDIKPVKESSVPIFIVNGNPIQFLKVPTSNFAPKDKKLTDMELLEEHKVWESNYLSEELYKVKLDVKSEKIKKGDRAILLWSFVRPSSNENYTSDYFMTTIIDSTLLAVGTSIQKADKPTDAKKMLKDIFKTLKISETPFDVEKIAESYRKS